MIDIKCLIEGEEYYFHFQNYFCSGFFEGVVNNNIHIKRGHFYYIVFSKGCNNSSIYAYEEAFIDIGQIIGFSVT